MAAIQERILKAVFSAGSQDKRNFLIQILLKICDPAPTPTIKKA